MRIAMTLWPLTPERLRNCIPALPVQCKYNLRPVPIAIVEVISKVRLLLKDLTLAVLKQIKVKLGHLNINLPKCKMVKQVLDQNKNAFNHKAPIICQTTAVIIMHKAMKRNTHHAVGQISVISIYNAYTVPLRVVALDYRKLHEDCRRK